MSSEFPATLAPSSVELDNLGFWRARNIPSNEELAAYYAEVYFQEGRSSYEVRYSDAELEYIRNKVALRWANVADRFSAPGRLLDVGCGEGFTLAYAKQRGWSVRGLDFSAAGVEAQNPDCTPDLTTGDVFGLLEDERRNGARYEILWLQNVLEHVVDPVALMQTLRQIMAPKGVLVVTVPNDFSNLQRAALSAGKIDNAFWVALPDHLSYFSASGLENIGQATGWECERVLGDFPVDWFLFNKEANYIANPDTGKAAHRARVELENLIFEQPIEKVVNFYSSLAGIGMGRDLTGFFTPRA